MNIKEHDVVAVVEDIPPENLREGDTGAIVHIYPDADAFVVEFTEDEYELRLVDLTPEQVRVVWRAPEEAVPVEAGRSGG